MAASSAKRSCGRSNADRRQQVDLAVERKIGEERRRQTGGTADRASQTMQRIVKERIVVDPPRRLPGILQHAALGVTQSPGTLVVIVLDGLAGRNCTADAGGQDGRRLGRSRRCASATGRAPIACVHADLDDTCACRHVSLQMSANQIRSERQRYGRRTARRGLQSQRASSLPARRRQHPASGLPLSSSTMPRISP